MCELIKKTLTGFFLLSLIFVFIGCIPIEATEVPGATLQATALPPEQISREEPQVSILPEKLSNGIKIQFWHPWSGETAVVVSELVDAFNQENPWGIQVEVTALGDDTTLVGAITAALENKGAPDLVSAPDFAIHGWFDKGQVADISEILSSSTWGLAETIKAAIPEIFWRTGEFGSSRISLPAYRSARLLFYNISWANDLGFDKQPADINEFKNQNCRALQANSQDRDITNNGTGGWFFDTESDTVLSWLKTFNGGVFPSKAEQPIRFATDENINAYQYLFDLFHNDCAWVGRDDKPYMYFADRKTLTYSGRLEDILIQERAEIIGGYDDEWTVMPYPGLNDKPVLLISGDSYAILNREPMQFVAAWVFAKWMVEAKQSAAIVEASGSFPVNINALGLLTDFRQKHPQWDKALQLLPFAQSMPLNPAWLKIGSVIQDAAWQISQFNQQKSGIPTVIEQAETLMNVLKN